MATNIPIYIPTFINSATYAPARVLPHLYFYNGNLSCANWYIEDQNTAARQQTNFPYFDNYNVVSGSFPTSDSRTLLFNNETAPYGEVPTQTLYSQYWSTYVSLLYNPYTRLLNCKAIIPLKDYFELNLNDIVNFHGNYYHLRAINDYNLSTSECTLQLLGPIIPDTFNQQSTGSNPPATGSASSSINWSYTENSQDGQFKVYDNATTLTTLTANGSGTAQVSQSHYVTASLVPVNYPSSGSVTMSLFVNGGTTISTTAYTNTTITASFLVGSGSTYNITGSIRWNAAATSSTYYEVQMCTSGTPSGATYIMNATDITPSVGSYYKLYAPSVVGTMNGSNCWNVIATSTAAPDGNGTFGLTYGSCGCSGSATLAWTYSVTGAPTSNNLALKVNGSVVESRSNTSSGNYTVYVGDVIQTNIGTSGCTGGNSKANAYCTGIINDASCATGTTTLISATYTVVSGDIGNALHLDNFAACDSGCL